MFRFAIWLLLFVAILAKACFAQSVSTSSGVYWLSKNQNRDSSWGNTSSSTTQFAATAESLDALLITGYTDVPYQNGMIWLGLHPVDSTGSASTRTVLRAKTALDYADDLKQLLTFRNTVDNNWGLDGDYTGDTLQTALALQALKAVNSGDISAINTSLAYLTASQNADGGWGFNQGTESNIFMTSTVSATLQQFPQMASIAAAVSKASAYLLAHQNSDGSFGSPATPYETALAYIALVGDGQTQGLPLQNAVNYLTSTQSANGSWNDDPYSTALAVKALHFSENKPSPPPPPPPGGRITGTVIDATTKAPVSGVAVAVAGNALIYTTTDPSGNFTLHDVPSGSQTVRFSLSQRC